MSLKGDRYILESDNTFFFNQVATRGGVATISTGGSGSALDQSQALLQYATNPSGLQPIGILLEDMVNYDLTRQHANYHRDEVQLGGKVAVIKKGWVVTNSLVASASPVAGDIAIVGESGLLDKISYASYLTGNQVNKPKVGRYLSAKEDDGYAKVAVEL